MPGLCALKILIFLFFTLPVFADDCQLYVIQGEVGQKETSVTLTVNKGANSKRVYNFSKSEQFRMGPYFQKTVKGSFLVKGTSIVKIESVAMSVPDPLFHHNEQTFVKDLPCPK